MEKQWCEVRDILISWVEVTNYNIWVTVDNSRHKLTIRGIAEQHGWNFVKEYREPPMLSFVKDNSRINVFYNSMTVATVINHPKQGRTQLFRRKVNNDLLKQIFKNPRVHTPKGYKRIKDRKL